MESDVFKFKTLSNFMKVGFIKLKRFLGLDKISIRGYLYLVTMDITVCSPISDKLSSTKVKDIKIVVKVTPDENKLNKSEFLALIASRSRAKVTQYYSDLVDTGGTKYNKLIWACVVNRLSHMKICPVYKDEAGKLAV
jgi:hypothetical protein